MLITEVQNRWEDADRDQRLDAALKYNQRLWTFFQAEVSQAENPLPAHIKENILSLSMFVDRRIFDVMAFPAREKLDILVTINRNIAAGLLGNPG
jgi:flagellar protein FlaF